MNNQKLNVGEKTQEEEHQEGDVLFWDNRGLIHRAMDQLTDEPSKSYRIGVYDEFPFYEMPGNEAGNPARPSDPDRLTASDLAS